MPITISKPIGTSTREKCEELVGSYQYPDCVAKNNEPKEYFNSRDNSIGNLFSILPVALSIFGYTEEEVDVTPIWPKCHVKENHNQWPVAVHIKHDHYGEAYVTLDSADVAIREYIELNKNNMNELSNIIQNFCNPYRENDWLTLDYDPTVAAVIIGFAAFGNSQAF